MNNGSLNVAIGDATGHGMKAGTMVTMIKSLFMVNSSTKEMTEFFKLTNEAIKNSNLRRMMVGFAMLNIYGNKLKVVNAGMPPVYYYKNFSSEVVEVGGHNLPLGAMNKSKYNADEIDMKHGDVILMLSDGFPELQNDKNEQYGYKKLVETLLQVGSKRADEFINVFKNEVTDWNGNKELEDDITFVVIKVK
jgi:serine phosphatase RsbU (regulator of sigma subunit)